MAQIRALPLLKRSAYRRLRQEVDQRAQLGLVLDQQVPSAGVSGQAQVPSEEAAEAIAGLLATADARCGHTTVVAIDGRAGAGKSTLAGRTAALTGATVIHTDDLFDNWGGFEDAIDRLSQEILPKLAKGEAAPVHTWDWVSQEWRPPTQLEPVDLLIVEGCGAASTRLSDYIALAIWVEVDTPTRQARAALRPDWSEMRSHWDEWAAQEDRHAEASRLPGRADLIVSD